MRVFVYTGGTICPDTIIDRPKKEDYIIAADSGYGNAVLLGVRPDVAVGDFDSFDRKKIPSDIETVEVPAEKDFTDTELAVNIAKKKGATDIVIIGGLGGRLDHTLSNLSILEDLCAAGIRGLITDGYDRIRFIRSTSELIAATGFKYLSVIAVDKVVKGLSIEGCRYPLKNAKLRRADQYAVSNEIEKNCALISVKKGGIYIVESSERK